MKRSHLYIIFLFSTIPLSLSSQEFSEQMCLYEDSLKNLGHDILYGSNDSVRLEANSRFTRILERAIQDDSNGIYPFDSLVTVSRIRPDDGVFRLFNWNVPLDDGTFRYFGFIQFLDPDFKGLEHVTLRDRSHVLDNPRAMILTSDQWFGALYYTIIPRKYNNKTCYTLLGWDGNNPVTRKKIIEVLSFKEDGTPLWGAHIFRNYGNYDHTRIIFEYAASASMSLKYEEQSYFSRDTIGNRIRMKEHEAEMIVFDRLIPFDPALKDRYQFYVPAGNIVDGFVFRDGAWEYREDINAKNPPDEDDLQKEEPTELELIPPR